MLINTASDVCVPCPLTPNSGGTKQEPSMGDRRHGFAKRSQALTPHRLADVLRTLVPSEERANEGASSAKRCLRAGVGAGVRVKETATNKPPGICVDTYAPNLGGPNRHR